MDIQQRLENDVQNIVSLVQSDGVNEVTEVQLCFEDFTKVDAIYVAGMAAAELGSNASDLADCMDRNPLHMTGMVIAIKREIENGKLMAAVSSLHDSDTQDIVSIVSMLEHYGSGLGRKVADEVAKWSRETQEQI